MAGTTTQARNASVKFKGKPVREAKRVGLPKAVRSAAKRGLISERQMAKVARGG